MLQYKKAFLPGTQSIIECVDCGRQIDAYERRLTYNDIREINSSNLFNVEYDNVQHNGIYIYPAVCESCLQEYAVQEMELIRVETL